MFLTNKAYEKCLFLLRHFCTFFGFLYVILLTYFKEFNFYTYNVVIYHTIKFVVIQRTVNFHSNNV